MPERLEATLVGPARYDKISVEAFRSAMRRCMSEPGQRSARAVLRLTREQLLARPGGAYRRATPIVLGLATGSLLAGLAILFWQHPLAITLRENGIGYGLLVVAVIAILVLRQGRAMARWEDEDREAILAEARAAWNQLKQFEPEPDPIYHDTLRQLANPG
jgi:hypothetical protein